MLWFTIKFPEGLCDTSFLCDLTLSPLSYFLLQISFDDALSSFEEEEMLVFRKSEIRGLNANKWFEAMLCRVNSYSCGDSKKESHPALDF